jgi:hypothetical protein
MAVHVDSNTEEQRDHDVTYEQLIQLEYEFVDAEDEICKCQCLFTCWLRAHPSAVRQQYALEAPLYKRRSEIVSNIPGFWALVLEQAPPEVDQYIQPSDSQIFGECLSSVEVNRFETDTSPRSFSIKFTFDETANEWFEDTVLEKKFWHRRAQDGWTGYVSEPVKVHWKKGKDLTHGLTDTAFKLWEAKRKQDKIANGSGAKSASTLSEYKELAKKLERHDPTSSGFFTLFGFVSDRRFVTAEESTAASAADKERRAKLRNGEAVPEAVEEDEAHEDSDVEVCPHGADLATVFVEDVWPNAIKYFSTATKVNSNIKFNQANVNSLCARNG